MYSMHCSHRLACISHGLAQGGLYIMASSWHRLNRGGLSIKIVLVMLAAQGVNEERFDWEMVVSHCFMSVHVERWCDKSWGNTSGGLRQEAYLALP